MRLAVVSYLNSRPFVEGLQQAFAPDELQVIEAVPAECGRLFTEGAVEVALLPVGALLHAPPAVVLPEVCIGAAGSVDSVFIVSHRPLAEVRSIHRDAQSLTSNGLAEVLLTNHWRLGLTWTPPLADLDTLSPDAATVVIGDRALTARGRFAHVIDLAAAWQDYSGLPFAFAVWAVRPGAVSNAELVRLQQALAWGLDHRAEVAARWAARHDSDPAAATDYLLHAIDYRLDDSKLAAIRRYLGELAPLRGLATPAVELLTLTPA